MPNIFKTPIFGLSLLLMAMASFQLGAGFATKIMHEIGPFGATALRQGFSALAMFFMARIWRFSFKNIALKHFIIYGFALAIMNLTFYIAIDRIPLGIVVAIEFTGPLFVGLISSRKPLDFLWIAFAAFGLFLLLPISQFSADLDKIGLLCAFLAAIGWAIYIISGHKLGQNFDGLSAVAIGIILSSLMTIPLGIYFDGGKIFEPKFLLFGLGLGLLSSAIPYSIEMQALKRLGRRSFSLFMSLEPALATLAGAILLSQKLAPIQILAICLIMAASIGNSLFSNKSEMAEIAQP